MKAQLRTMLGPTGSVLRQSHLVRFFDAWKAGDYTLAFDNLHRYYDYAMQTREKTHYQFALLHMAILHADFGCFSESIAAINETIATARETQDMHCLNFSLSWLSHMSKAYPMQMKGAGYMGMLGSERDGLTFLKAKAKETRMYNLLSASLLNEAKLCMASVSHVTYFHYLRQLLTDRSGRIYSPGAGIYVPSLTSQYQREHLKPRLAHSAPFNSVFSPWHHASHGSLLRSSTPLLRIQLSRRRTYPSNLPHVILLYEYRKL
jgi:hypothetical protein